MTEQEESRAEAARMAKVAAHWDAEANTLRTHKYQLQKLTDLAARRRDTARDHALAAAELARRASDFAAELAAGYEAAASAYAVRDAASRAARSEVADAEEEAGHARFRAEYLSCDPD